jgi:hypothetical protein
MVQEVRIPFSALNNVLPTSQFEDVEFQVPEVADLVDGVETALPTRQDIREVMQQELRDLERDVPDLQVPVDEIGEAVAREVGDLADEVVNIEISGLFGPTERDIEQAFEELFDVGERLDPDLIPSIAEVQQAVTDGIEDALRGTLGVDPNRLGDLLEDLLACLRTCWGFKRTFSCSLPTPRDLPSRRSKSPICSPQRTTSGGSSWTWLERSAVESGTNLSPRTSKMSSAAVSIASDRP